jgi:hypothetical protein
MKDIRRRIIMIAIAVAIMVAKPNNIYENCKFLFP